MATTLLDPRVTLSRRRDLLARVAQVFDFLFGLLYALLGIRLILDLIEARRTTGFYELIASVTGPFYAPFRGIVRTDSLDGVHPIVWPLVVAIVAYVLLHAAIRALLRLLART
jgi:YggT family protein